MAGRGEDIAAVLRAFGLTYPGTAIKSPWPGHADLAVRDKTFVYLPPDGEPFSAMFKLPFSAPEVLELPFARPGAYGLGKSGWVGLKPEPDQIPPLDTLKDWLDESYRAQASKTLIKLIPPR